MKSVYRNAAALFLSVLFTTSACASILVITPTSTPRWQGTTPKNPKAEDIPGITGFAGTVIELYKQDVGGSESGAAAPYYTTTFSNTPSDPSDSDIVWNGPLAMLAKFMLVKNGNHDPVWYVFDLSSAGLNWNGTDKIELRGFWPAGGAISHVSFFNPSNSLFQPPPPPPSTIPEPGSMAIWGLLASLSLGFSFMRRSR